MTVARAPGKIVLSGAYVVLEGAPAIVASVGRWVVADASRPAERVTEEVRVAIERGELSRACAFDASDLRTDGGARKLGLGSSAAILVATMAAVDGPPRNLAECHALLRRARAAHRAAQGGGSGVDVAASVLGGVLLCTLRGDGLDAAAHALPGGTSITILASATAASTPAMLALVAAHATRDPAAHRELSGRAAEGARAAVAASDVASLVEALRAQRDALGELGERAGAPIVTADLAALGGEAASRGFFLGPAGAGGGDVAILVGPEAPPNDLLDLARKRGLVAPGTPWGVPGVHALEPK